MDLKTNKKNCKYIINLIGYMLGVISWPLYYLGEKFEPWWPARGPANGWFAVSATLRQGAFGAPAPGFIRKPEDSYAWLKPYTPVAQVGRSIFVYKLP